MCAFKRTESLWTIALLSGEIKGVLYTHLLADLLLADFHIHLLIDSSIHRSVCAAGTCRACTRMHAHMRTRVHMHTHAQTHTDVQTACALH